MTIKLKLKTKLLDEDSQSIKNDQKVANIFNSFFANTPSNLKSYNKPLSQNTNILVIVRHAIENFENHVIVAIKNKRNPNDLFSFNPLNASVALI